MSCIEVCKVTVRRLGQLETKLAELQALDGAMTGFLCRCDAASSGGTALDCSILEDSAAPVDETRLL